MAVSTRHLLLISTIIVAACSTTPPASPETFSSAADKLVDQDSKPALRPSTTAPLAKTVPTPSLAIPAKKYQISPGQTVLLNFYVQPGSHPQRLECDKQSLPFFTVEDQGYAYFAESYFSTLASRTCVISMVDTQGNISTATVAKISIVKSNYRQERLNVAKAKVNLSPKDARRVREEKKMFKRLYATTADIPLFSKEFSLPLPSKITSPYGVKRIFNNSETTQHLGIDFRAKLGTPVHATNRGRVVFVGDTFYGGTAVAIDHGIGIFTLYAHLSKANTRLLGKIVEKGEKIGLTGKSGRATAPHLHWGTNVQGHNIDGRSLVKQSKLFVKRVSPLQLEKLRPSESVSKIQGSKTKI